MLLTCKWSWIASRTMLSKLLPIHDGWVAGLLLALSARLPFLDIGHTLACFHTSVNLPPFSDWLKISTSGSRSSFCESMRIYWWIKSGPHALFSFNLTNNCQTIAGAIDRSVSSLCIWQMSGLGKIFMFSSVEMLAIKLYSHRSLCRYPFSKFSNLTHFTSTFELSWHTSKRHTDCQASHRLVCFQS